MSLARAAFSTLLALTTVALLMPAEQLTTRGPDDKVGHVLTFLVLALSGRWARIGARPLLLGLVAYAAATEVLQALLPVNRRGDLLDLVADVGGVALGLVLAALTARVARRDMAGPG